MLKVVSAKKALGIIEKELGFVSESEQVALSECSGRILFEDIIPEENIPAFNRSTVDGFAVKASDTYGSGESIPSQLKIAGEIFMGERAELQLKEGECAKISTGGMLPEGADSVVMVEHTDTSFDDFCLVFKAVSPFENVTKKGDDISSEGVALEKGRHLSSREVGILAALGKSRVKVAKKPLVGIISTGDEIVPIEEKADFGRIRDINSHILASLMQELGCVAKEYGIVGDEREKITAVIKKAVAENDIVLVSGGSSAGARDMTAQIVSELGELFLHGIAIKPGKPTLVGKIDQKAVFGLPGHPAASYFVALRFIKPLVERALSKKSEERTFEGYLGQNISSNHGREEIVCVKIEGEKIMPIFGKSGVISLLSHCDGYIIIDRDCEGLKSDDRVQVNLF